MDANQLGDTLSGMTSGEDSPLGSLLGVGDFQAVFQMAGAVNSLMNAQSAPDSAAAGALNETEEQRNNTAKKKAVTRAATRHERSESRTVSEWTSGRRGQ